MSELFKEFMYFVRQEKKWWLVPLLFILFILGSFILFAETSVLAPFIYPFF